jgi:hypothetical protein
MLTLSGRFCFCIGVSVAEATESHMCLHTLMELVFLTFLLVFRQLKATHVCTHHWIWCFPHPKLGKTCPQAFEMMRKTYDMECMAKTQVYKWFWCFEDGYPLLKDDLHDEKVATAQYADTTAQCHYSYNPQLLYQKTATSLRKQIFCAHRSQASVMLEVLSDTKGIVYQEFSL